MERVVIESLRGNTFIATVVVALDGGPQEVDARPSDALNLAARLDAPIFVAADVMDHAGIARNDDPPPPAPSGPRGLAFSPASWRSVTPALISSLRTRRVAALLEQPMTEPSRRAMALAREEAHARTHDHIAPEHVLLAVLREPGGLAAGVLDSIGVTAEAVRALVADVEGTGEAVASDEVPISPRTTRALGWAGLPARAASAPSTSCSDWRSPMTRSCSTSVWTPRR